MKIGQKIKYKDKEWRIEKIKDFGKNVIFIILLSLDGDIKIMSPGRLEEEGQILE